MSSSLELFETATNPVEKSLAQPDHVLFDSASCNFSISVFIKELFVHLLVPFTYFINPIQHGWFYWKFLFGVFWYTHIPTLSVLMILVSYPLSNISTINMVIPLTFYVTHKLMVSFKYATLSTREYEKIKNSKSNEECNIYQSQLQVLTGLSHPATIKFELECAAAKVGSYEGQLHFILPSPNHDGNNVTGPSGYDTWSVYLKSLGCDILTLPKTADNRRKLEVFELSRLILVASSTKRFCFIVC